MSLLRATRTTRPLGDVLEPAFAAGGVKHTVLNGELYRYGAGEYLVASVDQSDERPPWAIGVGHAPPPLLDALARLLALLDQPADVPALAAGIEREILWRLLTGPQAATIRQIGIADSRLAHVARAIRWIRDHYERPFASKTSPRSRQ